MNLLLLSPRDFFKKNCVIIKDHRLSHLLKIHKLKAGDIIKIGLINGDIGTATVTSLSTHSAELITTLTQSPPEAIPVKLIIALPRPKMIKRILQTCATMGVKDIIFLNSYRVEKSYWQSPLLQEAQINEQLILGLEQGKDTLLPRVTFEKRFKPFVEDRLPSYCKQSLALVAHPYSAQPCPSHVTEATTLVIGPEGGFIPYEVDKLIEAGCQGITLGPRILRVETAIPVLLSKLFY